MGKNLFNVLLIGKVSDLVLAVRDLGNLVSGLNIVSAGSANDALGLMKEGNYDCAVVSYNVPQYLISEIDSQARKLVESSLLMHNIPYSLCSQPSNAESWRSACYKIIQRVRHS